MFRNFFARMAYVGDALLAEEAEGRNGRATILRRKLKSVAHRRSADEIGGVTTRLDQADSAFPDKAQVFDAAIRSLVEAKIAQIRQQLVSLLTSK